MPPVVFNAGSSEPVGVTPAGFEMLNDVVVALADSVSSTLATTPADMAFVFKPVSRQVNRPGAEVHDSIFPDAVAAGPAVAPIAEIRFKGYARVHCKAAGAVPPTPKDRARPAVAPGVAVADERLRLETWANEVSQI
jgi:hypothetical protein